MSLHCSNFRLLKVLSIVGSTVDLKSLDELIHLKYLELRDCVIDLSSSYRMKRLETLDVRGCECENFGEFWRIGTLMHVLADETIPKATQILNNNLQTLKWVTLERACDAKLPNLRKLGLYNSNELSMTNLLQTLPFLLSLAIISTSISSPLTMEIVYPKALPHYQNLQSLYLVGAWPENVNVEAGLFPPHLVKLTLHDSRLNHDPMPELGRLNSLKKLILGDYAFKKTDGGEARCLICAEGFPVLQHLTLSDYNESIEDLTVAQGVMPKLTYLKVRPNVKVNLPPELLQHVTVEYGNLVKW